MSLPDLVVVGDCNPDVVIAGPDVTPVFGQRERIVEQISLRIGGSAAITAVAAARLGLQVALVAAIGDDPAGALMLSLLAAEGVRTDAVAVRPGLATGMTVVLSSGQDRAILTAPAAIATLTVTDIPADLLGRARHLHVSSYFLVESSLGSGLAGLLAAAGDRGLSTSLDTNDDPAGAWGGEALRAVLAETSVFLPNEAEALAISGQQDVAAAAARLAAAGPAVVVKLGARGALCVPAARPSLDRADLAGHAGAGLAGAGAGSARRADRPEPVLVSGLATRAVDTTGAGDCFNAGLIAGLLRGMDLLSAAALGCAVGAAATQAVGGTGAIVDLATALRLAEAAVTTPAPRG